MSAPPAVDPAKEPAAATADRAMRAGMQLFWRKLKRRPYDFDLFFTLRMLQARHPELPRLGKASRPQFEPIRLGQDPSLAFAPATIAEVLPGTATQPERLMVWSFGLYGPNGPMPTHLTEYVRERLRQFDDPTLARFSDIFHHRLLLLFFRAWSDVQPTTSLDIPGGDNFGRFVGSIVGIGEASQQRRDDVPDHAKLFLAGHFTRATRNPEGLARAISIYFGVAVQVQEFCLHYLELEPAQQTRLTRDACNSQLGIDAVVGSRVPDAQSKFRLRIGPLDLPQYERFLPGGDDFQALIDWVRNYLGVEYAWDFELVLKREAVPRGQLGGAGRLGWTSWALDAPPTQDADDFCLDPERWLKQRRQPLRGRATRPAHNSAV